MRVVVQKCLQASVIIDNKVYNKIDKGFMLLVGFTEGDNSSKIDWMINKISNLRVFEDDNKVMNLSIKDVKGEILSISQFTLYGDATKGNRPSYTKALKGDIAIKLYDEFNMKMKKIIPTFPGIFGSDMKVSLINLGPTTIILDK